MSHKLQASRPKLQRLQASRRLQLVPDSELRGDVHVFGDMHVAWFKDPDGNILNIINK